MKTYEVFVNEKKTGTYVVGKNYTNAYDWVLHTNFSLLGTVSLKETNVVYHDFRSKNKFKFRH